LGYYNGDMRKPGTVERFSANVADRRRKRGFSQSALAAELGIHIQTVKKWEAGRIPPARYIDEVARVLRCDISTLFKVPSR
jgi:transcriptional regulator with XRE-family HTH domain